MIEIKSPNQLLRDGEDLGAVFDAIANHQLNMPDVQRAFLAYNEGLLNAHAEELKVERDKADAAQTNATKALADAAAEAARLNAIADEFKAAETKEARDEVHRKAKLPEIERKLAEVAKKRATLDAEEAELRKVTLGDKEAKRAFK